VEIMFKANIIRNTQGELELRDPSLPIGQDEMLEGETCNPDYLTQMAEIETQPIYISAADFRNRFTDSEMDAILDAAYAGDAICRRLLFKLQTNSGGVNLRGAAETAGIAYLQQAGLVSAERAQLILAT
jgi:hypothetical protein